MNKSAVLVAVLAVPCCSRRNAFVPELKALYNRIEFLKP